MDEMNVKAVETKENKETRPKIIAVDFDGCLATNKFPEVGDPINKTISRLKQEQVNGAKVILWTNRRDMAYAAMFGFDKLKEALAQFGNKQ